MCECFSVGRSQLDVTSNTWRGPNSQTLHAAEIKFHTRRGEGFFFLKKKKISLTLGGQDDDNKKSNFSGFVAFKYCCRLRVDQL